MNFYICSTPYHIFISLCHLITKKEKGIFYLTTHDQNSLKLFINIEKKLRDLDLVNKVFIRKRTLIKERLAIESIIDRLEYKNLKNYICNSRLYLFPWNPYSLYTISGYLYRKSKKVVFIEDGANLYAYPKPSQLNLLIKKYVYGVSIDFFRDEKLEEILVQFPEKYPKHLKDKLRELNVANLFRNLNQTEKESIINIFLSKEEVSNLLELNTKDSVIVLTQPLSEDGFVTEEEKLKLYRNIVDLHSQKYTVLIKKHPRERTNYGFENIIELNGSFPSEIFTMLGIKFKKAIGICTSAVTYIDADERINTDEDFLKRRKQK
jgi:Alpha-2,8-polysialyltransferase (POLYST)